MKQAMCPGQEVWVDVGCFVCVGTHRRFRFLKTHRPRTVGATCSCRSSWGLAQKRAGTHEGVSFCRAGELFDVSGLRGQLSLEVGHGSALLLELLNQLLEGDAVDGTPQPAVDDLRGEQEQGLRRHFGSVGGRDDRSGLLSRCRSRGLHLQIEASLRPLRERSPDAVGGHAQRRRGVASSLDLPVRRPQALHVEGSGASSDRSDERPPHVAEVHVARFGGDQNLEESVRRQMVGRVPLELVEGELSSVSDERFVLESADQLVVGEGQDVRHGISRSEVESIRARVLVIRSGLKVRSH